MNHAAEMPAKVEAPTSAPAEFGHNLDETASAADLAGAGDQRRPVEDLHSLLLRISHHLDYETSERSTIYYRLLAIDAQGKKIEKQTKKRALRSLCGYGLVIFLAVAATLAWQSYGEATKGVIATRAPELGWSPQAKEMIAGWIDQLGWAKPSAETSVANLPAAATARPIPVAQTVPETVEAKAPAVASVDPEQMQQIMQSLTALGQSVQQLTATQDQLARQITALQGDDLEILKRVPAPPPLPAAAPLRKPIPAPSPRAPATAH
jgi:hypothetical protein